LPRALAQQAHDEVPDRCRRLDAGDQRWRLIEGVMVQELLGIAAERRSPREQTVQQAAHRIQVGRAAHVVHLVLDLLGRHVPGRARARVRQKLHGLGAVEPLVVRILLEPGEAEVEDVNAGRPLVAGLDDHVRRFQVAVDHTPSMRVGERVQDLIDDRPDDRVTELCLPQVVQGDAVDELHHEVR
jgi:hypothetical protein